MSGSRLAQAGDLSQFPVPVPEHDSESAERPENAQNTSREKQTQKKEIDEGSCHFDSPSLDRLSLLPVIRALANLRLYGRIRQEDVNFQGNLNRVPCCAPGIRFRLILISRLILRLRSPRPAVHRGALSPSG